MKTVLGHCKIKTMNNIRTKITGEKSIIIGQERNAPKNKEITRYKLQLVFNAWLQGYQSDAWTDLTSEERLVLSNYHFNRFVKEVDDV